MIEAKMNRRKRQVCTSWRMDETYIKVGGMDRFLYRAVDKYGDTIDFLLTRRRMKGSAQKFLNKAIANNGNPRVINIDKSGANKEGIKTFNKRNFKNLNNIVEQDHRNVKRRIAINTGFKDFESAQRTLAGIEIVNIIRKGQIMDPKSTTYKTFYSLAT
jgi:putative transposase